VQHWKEGGHDQLCKLIKKAGGAEQYNANEKYAEAVAVAVKKCAEDTKGQTCYICTQALHWKTKEGLVRGCACRGTAGFAHVSCLAEQAKILFAEAVENHLQDKQWHRWYRCSLCEQQYHGVVYCALGWACWKTYVGRPEANWARHHAMTELGNGLSATRHYEDALSVQVAELSLKQRVGSPEESILATQNNLALSYMSLRRFAEALQMRRDVYSRRLKLTGREHTNTLIAASNYATSLHSLLRFKEAKALLLKTIPVARRVLGEGNEITLKMRKIYARALHEDASATLDDLREAVTTLEDLERIARRVLGGAHPITMQIERHLQHARAALAARETPPTSN